MSKTGGGRGTNQYQIKGVGKRDDWQSIQSQSSRLPSLSLPPRSAEDVADDLRQALYEAVAEFPTAPGDIQATPDPEWTDHSASMAHVQPKGVERAIARFRSRGPEAIYDDATLEGMGFTIPEVVAVIGGTHVPGHTDGEQLQVADMAAAARYLSNRAEEGPIEPSQSISDDLHVFIGGHLNVPTPEFRGDQSLRYLGPTVGIGRGEQYRALDARVTHAALDLGLHRIQQIEHPVVRGATWAAFAAYHSWAV